MPLKLCSSLEDFSDFDELKKIIAASPLHFTEDLILFYSDARLQVSSNKLKNIYCDFLSDKFLKEVRQNFSKSDSVYSFLKNKKGDYKILDLTAGFARDAFKFVLAGHDVLAFEKNPIVFFLLKDAVDRFFASEKAKELKEVFKVNRFQFNLKFGEASADASGAECFDYVYYDPMFEDASKKAAPKKSMQILKILTEGQASNPPYHEVLSNWAPKAKNFIYKSSNLEGRSGVRVNFEKKGKGFSFYSLSKEG